MYILRKSVFLVTLILLCFLNTTAQYNQNFYMRATEQGERQKTHERIIQNIIEKNLSVPLSPETEEQWEAAFNAMEVVNFHNTMTWEKMHEAMTALPFQSTTFQRYTLEAAYTLYPGSFMREAESLLRNTSDPKIFAMCAVYLAKSENGDSTVIMQEMQKNFGDSALENPILNRLIYELNEEKLFQKIPPEVLKEIFSKSFMPGSTLMISIQRKNRNFPGMVIVRKKDGTFLKTDGAYFHVPQLARGIANLPYFLTKGNTPQGIYRMFGFGVSTSQFIGPTANVQMGMPFEISKTKFFDKNQFDSIWTLSDYEKLLPESIRNYQPLYESFYAGKAGRNEIIAHGTTIDPELYKGKPYYPMTPTEGCLCTKEFWDGKLIYSDQQKLVNALLSSGGASGYVLVIDLDNKNTPVSMNDIRPFLP